eukprot:CAMPEP_0182478256 /NCGR_PEP_ID=MMETSP1319-20130603/32220_1 /TAXON_ID=172717 /ORGANISM="Bolidomonas pacifica, Strain RCC208" /LENGTH=173 /DNA_ID=CAMNT_0024679575 /DNA_START=55 /DNA_END=577 /DNA_ORIENTATION=+
MDMKIGAHCADPTCNQLDFLPWRCRGCSELFCAEHNAAHSCAQTAQLEAEEDRWAVECPLCNRNVAAMPGETRDTAVSRHMERGCKPRKARKHRCAVRGCKTKEMISGGVEIVHNKCALPTETLTRMHVERCQLRLQRRLQYDLQAPVVLLQHGVVLLQQQQLQEDKQGAMGG